jgi:hypothetical protein
MATHLHRSIDQPFREGLSWSEKWQGSDNGLIFCWERGRQIRVRNPNLAARADNGELVILAWRGGVEEKLKTGNKSGTLNYLATWQGLRGEDLNLDLDIRRVIVCTRTQQAVEFGEYFLGEDE